jgi:hypothetical protein
VWVLEGEKCAGIANKKCGVVATTSAFGAQSPHKTDWSPVDGKDVYVVPDNDKPGREYARQVGKLIGEQASGARVRTVVLPNLSPGEDIEQWEERLPSPDEARAELERLAADAPLVSPRPRRVMCASKRRTSPTLPLAATEDSTKEVRAAVWLKEILSTSPHPEREIVAMAGALDYSKPTLKRAKKLASVESFRPPGQRVWWWRLAG